MGGMGGRCTSLVLGIKLNDFSFLKINPNFLIIKITNDHLKEKNINQKKSFVIINKNLV